MTIPYLPSAGIRGNGRGPATRGRSRRCTETASPHRRDGRTGSPAPALLRPGKFRSGNFLSQQSAFLPPCCSVLAQFCGRRSGSGRVRRGCGRPAEASSCSRAQGSQSCGQYRVAIRYCFDQLVLEFRFRQLEDFVGHRFGCYRHRLGESCLREKHDGPFGLS